LGGKKQFTQIETNGRKGVVIANRQKAKQDKKKSAAGRRGKGPIAGVTDSRRKLQNLPGGAKKRTRGGRPEGKRPTGKGTRDRGQKSHYGRAYKRTDDRERDKMNEREKSLKKRRGKKSLTGNAQGKPEGAEKKLTQWVNARINSKGVKKERGMKKKKLKPPFDEKKKRPRDLKVGAMTGRQTVEGRRTGTTTIDTTQREGGKTKKGEQKNPHKKNTHTKEKQKKKKKNPNQKQKKKNKQKKKKKKTTQPRCAGTETKKKKPWGTTRVFSGQQWEVGKKRRKRHRELGVALALKERGDITRKKKK